MCAKTWLLILVISVFSGISNAQIYKCLNGEHDTKYQNSPCIDSKQTEVKIDFPTSTRKQITLKQIQGHYFIAGEINGTKSNFLVDTGASFIALPQLLAEQAHIICTNQFVTMNTANGKVQACIANASKLSLSPFEFKDVQVLIHPNLDMPLLGMSLLQQFNIEQRNGEMHFSER
ncbi:MAG: retropepsin-like aspartic protease [Methylococcales bacterium]|nr:retropepsin-like aspartic protease [Methylococcales bacterium]MDD5754606.1 retropepsin-like aspartic protease [Methylococcales bacterium]